MTLFVLEDSRQKYEFGGERIGYVDTRLLRGRLQFRPRWLEMALYRKDGGGYVICRIQHSLVFHVRGARCAKGLDVPADELGPDSVKCGDVMPRRPGKPFCWPATASNGSAELVTAEQDLITIDRCPDYARVIRRLSEAYHRSSGVTSSVVSQPMDELLRQAALVDEDFASPDKPVVRL